MARMDAPSKVSMKGIGVSSKWSYQRPEMTKQVQKTQVLGPVQDSDLTVGPRLIGASPVWGPMLGLFGTLVGSKADVWF